MFDAAFFERLMRRLAGDLPGRTAHARLAPGLAYGRHRGPAPGHARQAAVALVLLQRNEGWYLPLTRRPAALQHHGGQISLPGGRVEQGESHVEAAVREFTEEMGSPPREARLIGELSPLYVFASDNQVQPVLLVAEPPEQPWHPDPVEVEVVIELPLSTLIDTASWVTVSRQRALHKNGQQVGHLQFRAPCLQIGTHRVWGATGMILAELAEVLRST